jgi:hypothetical protein
MDAAEAFAVSDLLHEKRLRRLWPPDHERKRPPAGGTEGARLEIVGSEARHNAAGSRVQSPAIERLLLERGVRHLHALGPRAVAELVAEVAAQTGGMPVNLNVLAKASMQLSGRAAASQ